MFYILHFILAIVVIFALALLVSHDRRKVRIRYIVQLLVIEGIVGWFFLNSRVGLEVIGGISQLFSTLLVYAGQGTDFVFGGMNKQGLAFVFLEVLCPIVFISALIGILQHWKILPLLIRIFGSLLARISGMGKLESFNAVSSLVLGQSENFIAYKGILGDLSPSVYTLWRRWPCQPSRCPSSALICR